MKIRYDLKAGHTWKGPQEEEVRMFLSLICKLQITLTKAYFPSYFFSCLYCYGWLLLCGFMYFVAITIQNESFNLTVIVFFEDTRKKFNEMKRYVWRRIDPTRRIPAPFVTGRAVYGAGYRTGGYRGAFRRPGPQVYGYRGGGA